MPFADPDLAFFIYYEDEPAAVCVIFPTSTVAQASQRAVGCWVLLKVLLYRGDHRIRCLISGSRRSTGMGSPCCFHHIFEWCGKRKYRSLEMGWTWRTMKPSTPCRGSGAQDLQEISHIQKGFIVGHRIFRCVHDSTANLDTVTRKLHVSEERRFIRRTFIKRPTAV